MSRETQLLRAQLLIEAADLLDEGAVKNAHKKKREVESIKKDLEEFDKKGLLKHKKPLIIDPTSDHGLNRTKCDGSTHDTIETQIILGTKKAPAKIIRSSVFHELGHARDFDHNYQSTYYKPIYTKTNNDNVDGNDRYYIVGNGDKTKVHPQPYEFVADSFSAAMGNDYLPHLAGIYKKDNKEQEKIIKKLESGQYRKMQEKSMRRTELKTAKKSGTKSGMIEYLIRNSKNKDADRKKLQKRSMEDLATMMAKTDAWSRSHKGEYIEGAINVAKKNIALNNKDVKLRTEARDIMDKNGTSELIKKDLERTGILGSIPSRSRRPKNTANDTQRKIEEKENKRSQQMSNAEINNLIRKINPKYLTLSTKEKIAILNRKNKS